MYQKIKKESGITLIVMIITIVILLILAGIAIIQLNNNGLFKNAKTAKEKYSNKSDKEQKILSDYADKISSISRDNINYISNDISDFEVEIIENVGNYVKVKPKNINVLNNNKILGYMYWINDEVVEVSNKDEYTYTELSQNTKYTLKITAIDKKGQLKDSKSVECTTLNRIIEPLDYPILTTTGMKNCKSINPNDTNDYYYDLNLDFDCTGTNALPKQAYDGDENTYVQAGEKTWFRFDKGYHTAWWYVKSENVPTGNSQFDPGYDNWTMDPGDWTLESNGYYRYTYYGYPGIDRTNIIPRLLTGGKIYEITTNIK